MTPYQVKAARTLLGWSVERLAALSDTSVTMVRVFEQTGRVVSLNRRGQMVSVDPVAAICTALEAAGVMFTSGDELGAKLRKPDQ